MAAAGIGGGTEHASAIFYGEKGVRAAPGTNLVAHEIAHQWFGNAVTERDWDDVWLSEGFATYFTHLFNEHYSGRDAMVAGLKRDIGTVLNAERMSPDTPVIHRNLADMGRVLNRFVYQKGGWVLHMLRHRIGTETFWRGIREYYRRYMNGSASTDDLRHVMEEVSGQDLRWFFTQWLNRPGVPKLEGFWRYDAANKRVVVTLRQTIAGEPFRLPVEIGLVPASGGPMQIEQLELTAATGIFTIAAETEPNSVELDPNTWLLCEKAAGPLPRQLGPHSIPHAALPNPPAVHRPAVEERAGRHDAVALEDQAVLHHELHLLQRIDVVERIAGHGDEVREESGLDRAARLLGAR